MPDTQPVANDSVRGIPEEFDLRPPRVPIEREPKPLGSADRGWAQELQKLACFYSPAHERYLATYPEGFGAVPPIRDMYLPSDPLDVIPLLRDELSGQPIFIDIKCGAGLAVAAAKYVGYDRAYGTERSDSIVKAGANVCRRCAALGNYTSGVIARGDPLSADYEFFDSPVDPAEEPTLEPIADQFAATPYLYFYRTGSLNLWDSPEQRSTILRGIQRAPKGSLFMIHKRFDAEIMGQQPEFTSEELLATFGAPRTRYEHSEDYTFTEVYLCGLS